jgi:hypothetical protein
MCVHQRRENRLAVNLASGRSGFVTCLVCPCCPKPLITYLFWKYICRYVFCPPPLGLAIGPGQSMALNRDSNTEVAWFRQTRADPFRRLCRCHYHLFFPSL